MRIGSFPKWSFAVSAANETLAGYMRRAGRRARHARSQTLDQGDTVYDLMQRAKSAYWACHPPVVYDVSWPTYLVAKFVVHIKFLGAREVVKEPVQGRLSAATLAATTIERLHNQPKRQYLQQELAHILSILGPGGAYPRRAGGT